MSKKRMAVVCGRVCQAPEGDYYVTCSFDPNHIILRSRMPYHIIKCIKQHPGHNKIQCPYDATEYIDQDEYQNHVLNCESRRSVADGKFQTAWLKANGRMCNIQQTPFFHEHAPVPDEDWGEDSEIEFKDLSEETVNDINKALIKEFNEDVIEDFDEDLFEDLRPVGRGLGRGSVRRNQDQKPKKGMGRAEVMKHLHEIYKERQSAPSHSSSSVSSMDKDARRHDISDGQFDDA